MNLYELDALIASFEADNANGQNDDIIAFYLKKRYDLVAEIAMKVEAGLRKL